MSTPVSLPAANESMRCSDFARAHRIDPGGTGLSPDAIVLVEVPEPWPKPVAKHDELVELVRAAAEHPEQVRLLAAVPHEPERRRVIALRPVSGGMTRAEADLDLADPTEALRSVLDAENPRPVLVDGIERRTILVCTQGSHDVCCGSDGVWLADELESGHWDVEVFRVSHTGGHRFAPTAMTLPDGRMWAYLTPDSVSEILDRTGDTSELADTSRGWWGVPKGPAQIAERELFAEIGWALDRYERTVTVVEDDGRYRVRVEVERTDSPVREVVVQAGREVPAIACDKPGGDPIKPRREWNVVSVEAITTR